jgi:hypothetical protein
MNGAKVEICGLGTRDRNPQLGFVKVIWPSLASMKISFNASDGMIYLSPEKIYSLLQNACDSALTALSNRIILSGKEYMVYRHYSEKKPFTIIVIETEARIHNNLIQIQTVDGNMPVESNNDMNNNPTKMPINCKIDLIPAIKFDFSSLPRNEGKWDRVYFLKNEFSCLNIRTFEAIPLKISSGKPRFRISFLQIEKEILKQFGCLEEVTMLIKHLRNKCFPFLNWYVLKAVIMWVVLERKHIQGYWEKEHIEACFIDMINELLTRLDKAWVPDIFFTKFNRIDTLLGKKYYSGIESGKYYDIKQTKHLSNTRAWLYHKLDAYRHGQTSILSFFSKD